MPFTKNNFIVIALGGSILVPRNIQTDYIRRLRTFLLASTAQGRKFVLIVGGGAVARMYQKAAAGLSDLSDEDKDWLGIRATRLTAQFLQAILGSSAYPRLLTNPEESLRASDLRKYDFFIGAGWRPGASTDYVAFRWAQNVGARSVLIATTISHVYDKDVGVYKDARPIDELSWDDYIKLVGAKWTPGMKAPVDPIAAQFARQNDMSAVVLRGTNIRNMRRYMNGEAFEGTTIRP